MYHRRRSRTPDVESGVLSSRSLLSSRKSLGAWGSMNNLHDSILSNLQESIQQKQKECYTSYESLDKIGDSDTETSSTKDLGETEPFSSSQSDCKDDRTNQLSFFSAHSQEVSTLKTDVKDDEAHSDLSKLAGPQKGTSESTISVNSSNSAFTPSTPRSFSTTRTINSLRELSSRSSDFNNNPSLSKSGSTSSGSVSIRPTPLRIKDESPASAKTTLDHSRSTHQVHQGPAVPSQSPRTFKAARHVFPSLGKSRPRWDSGSPVLFKQQITDSKENLVDDAVIMHALPNSDKSGKFNDPLKILADDSKPTKILSGGVDTDSKMLEFSPRSLSPPVHDEPIAPPSPITDPDSFPVPPKRASRNHLSPSRKMWSKPERCLSPLAQSLHSDKPTDNSPNKSLAFYVPCSDESSVSDLFSSPKPDSNKDTDTSHEKSPGLFPQWVVPFIDDSLTGQFEYVDSKQGPAKSRSRSMPPSRVTTSSHSTVSSRGTSRPVTPSKSPTDKSKPSVETSRSRYSRPTTVSATASKPTSPPVAPPRTKRDANKQRASTKNLDVNKSTDSSRKVLPKVPVSSSKDTGSTNKKEVSTDESDLFPIHYVQHSEPVTPQRGRSRTPASTKRVPLPSSKTSESNNVPAAGKAKSGASVKTNNSSLASRRSKSLSNLAFVSQSEKKDSVSDRKSSLGPAQSLLAKTRESRKLPTPNTTSQSDKPATTSRSRLGSNSSSSSVATSDSKKTSTMSPTSSKSLQTKVDSKVTRPDNRTVRPENRTSRPENKTSRRGSSSDSSSQRSLSVSRSVGSSPVTVDRASALNRTGPGRPPFTHGKLVSGETRSRARGEDTSVDNSLPAETSTLPRRRSKVDAASTHTGGYSTLRPSMSSTPKKSILKTSTGPSAEPKKPPKDEQVDIVSKTRTGRRTLPAPPPTFPEAKSDTPRRSRVSSRPPPLTRSSSREETGPGKVTKGGSNLAKNRAKSLMDLSSVSSSDLKPVESDVSPRRSAVSTATRRGSSGDTLRVRPRSPVLPSGHVISDRYRRLMDGDFVKSPTSPRDNPAKSSGTTGPEARASGNTASGSGKTPSGSAASVSNSGSGSSIEKENSFDSGVEFVMHL